MPLSPRTEAYYLTRIAALDQQPNLVGVNLGGAGETPGYINVNNRLDRRDADAIPNLIEDAAENVAAHFAPNSVHHVVANNIVPHTMNWAVVARGVFKILRPGGIVSLAEFAGGYDKGVSIRRALEAAGFRDVVIIRNTLVVAEK